MNDKYLKESIDVLNRDFGSPLVTLEDTIKAHKLKKEGGAGSGRPTKDGSAKDIEKKAMKAADDANAKMDAAEKTKKNESDLGLTYKKGKTITVKHKKSGKELVIIDKPSVKREYEKIGFYAESVNEDTITENPAALAATAAMVQMKAKNPKTGRVNKLTTALSDKSHPAHKKAKGVFAKLIDKFKKKKEEPKSKGLTPDQSKAQAKSMGISVGESIKEGPEDVRFARRALSKIVKTEQKFRKQMYDLEQSFLQDPNPTNKTLAKEIKQSYKSGVTKYMRDSVLMVKRMK